MLINTVYLKTFHSLSDQMFHVKHEFPALQYPLERPVSITYSVKSVEQKAVSGMLELTEHYLDQ